jgi:hypothetical protein
LILITLAASMDAGGLIFYAAPVLLPLYWWVASQSGIPTRAVFALLAALVVVAVATLVNFRSPSVARGVLMIVGVAAATLVLASRRVGNRAP